MMIHCHSAQAHHVYSVINDFQCHVGSVDYLLKRGNVVFGKEEDVESKSVFIFFGQLPNFLSPLA